MEEAGSADPEETGRRGKNSFVIIDERHVMNEHLSHFVMNKLMESVIYCCLLIHLKNFKLIIEEVNGLMA